MNIGDKFQVGYNAKKYNGKFITRLALWDENCNVVIREDISYMVYFDLGRNGYRTASNSWVISKAQDVS